MDISRDKKILSNHYFLIGFALYQNNRIKESKKYLKRSLIIYPLNFKNTVKSILIISTNGQLYKLLSKTKEKIVWIVSVMKYGFYILRKKGIRVFLKKVIKFIKQGKINDFNNNSES